MSIIQSASLSQALLELTNVNDVYVRLALSRDDSGNFEARCLVVDVIPQRWLDAQERWLDAQEGESELLSPWNRIKGDRLFESKYALFFCGLRNSKTVSGWFARPDDCELAQFDTRPGYFSKVVRFFLPEFHDSGMRQRTSSHFHQGLPILPYPSSLYTIQVRHPEVSHLIRNDDGNELVGWDSWAASTSHFDSFAHARSEIIFGESNPLVAYQRQDLFAIRIVHPEGWLKKITVLPDKVDITVVGTESHLSEVVLAPAEVRTSSGPILNRHRHVSLPLPAQLPQRVDVILLCDDVRLDRAVFSRKDAPYPETSPQVVIKREDCAGYRADEAEASVDMEVEEQTDIAGIPKVFISYSHDSQEHKKRVLELANRLRGDGIECRIDRYITTPPEGWPKWMTQQILRWSDYVIVVCTKTYARRVNGEEARGKGLGAVLEGGIITQQIYEQSGNNEKFMPVIFSAEDTEYIPTSLRPTTWYLISTEQGYEDLYRYITGQPAVEMPPLGVIKRLPPRGE